MSMCGTNRRCAGSWYAGHRMPRRKPRNGAAIAPVRQTSAPDSGEALRIWKCRCSAWQVSWPGLRDLHEHRQIDLGVDGSGLGRAVAQDGPDGLQACARAQQVGGKRMPEYVRPGRHSFDPTAVARTSDDARYLSGRAEWPKRCLCTQEQMLFGGLRAGCRKICQDRVANILRQWQAVRSTRLALDRQVAGSPVDVVETHVLNIGSPQAEPGEQENDGLVPDFHRTICRTGRNDPLDRCRVDMARQRRKAVALH